MGISKCVAGVVGTALVLACSPGMILGWNQSTHQTMAWILKVELGGLTADDRHASWPDRPPAKDGMGIQYLDEEYAELSTDGWGDSGHGYFNQSVIAPFGEAPDNAQGFFDKSNEPVTRDEVFRAIDSYMAFDISREEAIDLVIAFNGDMTKTASIRLLRGLHFLQDMGDPLHTYDKITCQLVHKDYENWMELNWRTSFTKPNSNGGTYTFEDEFRRGVRDAKNGNYSWPGNVTQGDRDGLAKALSKGASDLFWSIFRVGSSDCYTYDDTSEIKWNTAQCLYWTGRFSALYLKGSTILP